MTERWNDVPLLWYILADGENKTNLQCQVLTRCNESFVHLQWLYMQWLSQCVVNGWFKCENPTSHRKALDKNGNGDEDSHVNPPLEAAVVLKTGKITRRGLLLINLSRMITDCKSPKYACKNHKQNLKGMEININSTS